MAVAHLSVKQLGDQYASGQAEHFRQATDVDKPLTVRLPACWRGRAVVLRTEPAGAVSALRASIPDAFARRTGALRAALALSGVGLRPPPPALRLAPPNSRRPGYA